MILKAVSLFHWKYVIVTANERNPYGSCIELDLELKQKNKGCFSLSTTFLL